MTLNQLRTQHPEFSFDSYSYKKVGGHIEAEFSYTLKPNIEFTHKLTLPCRLELTEISLDNLIFHLGLVVSISYWKSACSPVFKIKAGQDIDERAD